MISPSAYINLEKAAALVVDDNSRSLDILVSVLASFGLRNVTRVERAGEAVELLTSKTFDLILTDAQMPGMDGYDLVHWLRRNGSEISKVTPVIIVTAHTRKVDVMRARDCGANFIVSKPVSPKVLLERIFWVAKGDRMFIQCETYVGPDRRFKHEGPPADFPDGRRADDVPMEVPASPEAPNLSQQELDNLIKPQKVTS